MPNVSDDKFAARRHEMVARQIIARGIRDERVIEAMQSVPREVFLPHERREEAYEDRPVPIGGGQTISQPYVVALMCERLDAGAGDRILDVGAGSGYQAAVLARLGREVIAVERLPELARRAEASLAAAGAENVRVVVGDGTLGWPEQAPYDRIICGAAGPAVPPAWIAQLADDGRIVMPVGDIDVQELVSVETSGGHVRQSRFGGVRFVPLIGRQGWPER